MTSFLPGMMPVGIAPKRSPFPQVEAVNTYYSSQSDNAHVVLAPGIVAGDLLILFVRVPSGSITTPAGWTNLMTVNYDGTVRVGMYYKIANGNENDSPLLILTSQNIKRMTVSYRISGYKTGKVPETAYGMGSGNVPGPTTYLTASYGVDNTLWLATAFGDNVYLAPSGYTAQLNSYNNVILAATRNRAIAQETAGYFAQAGLGDWMVILTAIQPPAP